MHRDIWNFYDTWPENPDAFSTSRPRGLDEKTLEMFHELKSREPAPWMEQFADVVDVRRSLHREFVNQLYVHLRDREKQTADLAAYLLEKITEAAPEVREQIVAGLNPALVTDRERLQERLATIENDLRKTIGATADRITRLQREKSEVKERLDAVTEQLRHTSLLLARTVIKDAWWVDFVRRTMMPVQPGRVPFQNSAEVALRGFHAASGRGKPTLSQVTWSKLPYTDNGLHRGYSAGIVFKGSGFAPGVTWTCRRRGEDLPAGRTDYFWRLPNIYFGDYLEVSTGDDEPEGPLSWRDHEFQVKNPEGETSDWVLFSYPFDDELLRRIQQEAVQRDTQLLERGHPADAIGPLRRAYVFSDRLLGMNHENTAHAKSLWARAREQAALAKLRFGTGDRLLVRSGPHAGKEGTVERLLLNQRYAYLIKPLEGERFQASDEQVERADD